MNATKLLISSAAALMLAGTMGLASAQTPPAIDQTPTGTRPTGESQAKPMMKPMMAASAPKLRRADNMGTGMGNTGAQGNSPTATPVAGSRAGAASGAAMGMHKKPMRHKKHPATKGAARAASATPI